MKVRFFIGRHRFLIWIPYCLFFNRFVALIISEVCKEKGVSVSTKSVYAFMKSFKKELKSYKKLTVLEIDTVSGFRLNVKL